MPDAEMIAGPAAADPGEHVLNVIALRLLAAAPPMSWGTSLGAGVELAQLSVVAGLGDVVDALIACDALRVTGHGITAPPDRQFPDQWRSVLVQRLRSQGRGPEPGHGRSAATTAALPELDGARLTLLGLHDAGKHTMLAMHAIGRRKHDDNLGSDNCEDMDGEISAVLLAVPELMG